MKSPVSVSFLGLTSFLFLALASPSPAIWGLFSRGKNRLPTAEERAKQDAEAASVFAEAEAAQNAGKTKRALSKYERIAEKLPHARVASEALFRWAEIQRQMGEPMEAFSAYQQLIDDYPSSNRFQRSLEQQYNIAVESVSAKTESLLGIVPRQVGRDRVIKMFQQIIANGPASLYAANSYYYVGRIEEDREQFKEAVVAYQKVVDDYPKSSRAPQAQLRIAQLLETTAKRPDNPTNLQQTREAYEDFITNFPGDGQADDVVAQLNVIGEREARKNLKIGKFYQKKGDNKAAAIYFNDVLRSDNAPLNLEARQRLAEINQVDPSALKAINLTEQGLREDPAKRLKNQPNYVGPPAPDAVSPSLPRNDKVPAMPNEAAPELPPAPAPEPELPALDPVPELNVPSDTLIPDPPEDETLSTTPESVIDPLFPEESTEGSDSDSNSNL